METLIITGDCELSQKESTIRIKTGGGSRSVPVADVRHLVLMSDGRVSTKLLCLFGRHGIRLSVFDFHGWYKGSWEPIEKTMSGDVCLRQAAAVLDEDWKMSIACAIVETAAHNMERNLAYYAYRGNSDVARAVTRLSSMRSKFEGMEEIDRLMGAEGMFRREYLAVWPAIDAGLDFGPRKKRPPNNEINCLMSFLNGLCYATMRHEIFKTYLNETLSFLHVPSSGRSSLSLDLAEIFKPVLTDRLIIRMVRKGEISAGWFEFPDPNICVLSEAGRRAVAVSFSETIERKTGDLSLREEMRATCISLERHLWDRKSCVFSPFRARV